MNHLSWDDIWAKLDGELTDPVALQHLDTCPECMRRVEKANSTHQAILQSFKLPDSLPSDEEAVNRICAAVGQMASTPSKGLRIGRPFSRWLTTGVAVVAAGALTVGTLQQTGHFGDKTGDYHAMSKSVAVVNHPAISSSAVNHKAQSSSPSKGTIQSPAKFGAASGMDTSNAAAKGTAATSTSIAATAEAVISSRFVANVEGLSTNAATGSGTPLADAHVAVFCQGMLVGRGITGANGDTKPMHLQVPVDPVMAGTFARNPGLTPRGNATVLVWKAGYRPMVFVDVPIQKDQNELSALLKLNPGNKVLSPVVMESGLHVLEAGAYAKWVEQLAKATKPQEGKSSALAPVGSSLTRLRVQVVNETGHPVVGAHVAIVSGDGVDVTAKTTAEGWTPLLQVASVEDTRLSNPGMKPTANPQVVNVVAFKSGYAPYVMMDVPVQTGKSVQLQVRVESMHWRQVKGYNNADAPVGEPWVIPPSDKQAESLLLWGEQQVATR